MIRGGPAYSASSVPFRAHSEHAPQVLFSTALYTRYVRQVQTLPVSGCACEGQAQERSSLAGLKETPTQSRRSVRGYRPGHFTAAMLLLVRLAPLVNPSQTIRSNNVVDCNRTLSGAALTHIV